MRNVYIVSAARTAVGSFGGMLKDIPAPRLGAVAVSESVRRSGIDTNDVDEVYLGCVLPCAMGQAPARQAAIFAGLPKKAECVTVNKVCGSGLKAVAMGCQAIKCGDSEVVVSGGMENMDLAPFALSKARYGYRMGNSTLIDTMVNDGLWDVYNNFHMGMAAELCAKEYKYSREAQDEFARESYTRALNAIKEGKFRDEIVPVPVPQGKGDPLVFAEDEEPKKVDFDKIPKLKPAFKPDGTITAANASSINDGAAAVVLMSEESLKAKGIKPLARILGFSQHAQEPEWFTTAPAFAIEKLLKKLNMTKDQVDLWEINEAFSVVAMFGIEKLKLDHSRVNINGGAVSIGHPIGASGARILVTLIYALKNTGRKTGLATLCIGGGEAIAMMIEMV
jgi:acetyl-CoA C-acetyltransferase